jgi:hypothetical protein
MGSDKKRKELAINIETVLRKLMAGHLTIEQARRELATLDVKRIADLAKLDVGRARRIGTPEAVLAEGKDPKTIVKVVSSLVERNGYALVTRVERGHLRALRAASKNLEFDYNPRAKTVLVKKRGHVFPKVGVIGVLAAGTADVPVAEEAVVAARVMGCEVIKAYDVGIAGVHRLFEPLKLMIKRGISAIVVVAGMEGTLPSVVSSLVDVPVVGVPTSIGYGVGVKGLGALVTMLQTCSPKLAVVNINNGFGAGIFAASIARQASSRSKHPC